MQEITDLIPKVADQITSYNIFGSFIGFIIGLILMIVSLVIFSKNKDHDLPISLAIIGIALFICCGWDLIGWKFWPDAKVIQAVFNKR